ncbi:hypothetical protein EBB07_23850 [Paenibacillaceae bacterium]|nr:hypothetical protein EBB07_23850 [Paenibacillaceae bacterium]
MNKWAGMAAAMMLMITLTACGYHGTQAGNGQQTRHITESSHNTPAGSAAALTSDSVTTEELINKSIEASLNSKSLSVGVKSKQQFLINAGETKQNQTIHTYATTDLIKEPLAVYQEIETEIPGVSEPHKTIQYITKEGTFTRMLGQWFKLPDDTKDYLLTNIESQARTENQLEYFRTIIKDTKLSEDEDNYVLSATVSGNSAKELSNLAIKSAGSSNREMEAMFRQMKIVHMKLTYAIQKIDYLPVRMTTDLKLTMQQENTSFVMNMTTDSIFSNYNAVHTIKVPQEALESAK